LKWHLGAAKTFVLGEGRPKDCNWMMIGKGGAVMNRGDDLQNNPPFYLVGFVSFMELLEQAPVFTTPKNALSSTLHFSMFRPLAPSLDMLVTYGPAVVQPAKRMVK
jgi:hypothetical protein